MVLRATVGACYLKSEKKSKNRKITVIRMTDLSSVFRRLLMVVLMVALTVGIIEVLSFVVLGVIDRGWPSWSSLQGERSVIADSQEREAAADAAEERPGGLSPSKPRFAEDEVNRWLLRINEREVVHPYVGFVEQRHEDDAVRGREDRNVEANRYGYPRNKHGIFYEPQPDRLVVVVVGGSFSRQISFAGRGLIEEGLEASDRFLGRDVIVISLGLGGYKQPQQLMVVGYLLALGMHMDVLVNIDGFNEVVLPVTENIPLGVNLFFPRAWSIRVAELDPNELRLRGKVEHYQERRAHLAALFSKPPWRYSMTCSLFWRLLDRRALGFANRTEAEFRALGERHHGYQALGPESQPMSEEHVTQRLVEVWQRCSVLLGALARSENIEYYHFLQPNQYVAGSKKLDSAERRVAINLDSGIEGPVSRGYPLMRAAARSLRESGVTFVDLTEVFSEVDETVYRDDCCHVNELGIELVVDRILEVVATGSFEDGSNPRFGAVPDITDRSKQLVRNAGK